MADMLAFPSSGALLETSVVNEMLKDLADAFPGGARAKNQEGMLRTYRNHLAGVSELAARGAVKSIIRNDERFPSVSRIVAAAHEWTRRNVASPEFQLRHDPNRCQSCHEAFVSTDRWRPMLERLDLSVPAGSIALVPDPGVELKDRSVFLERYVRDVCACHVPCVYEPTGSALYGGVETATMPIAKLRPHDMFRLVDQLSRKRGSWRSTTPTQPLADVTRQLAAGGAS